MLLFSRQFEWRNQIWPNTAVQCTFCTGQRTFCTVFPSFLIEIFSLVGKTVRYVRCAMQNVHCAVVLDQIWLRHSNRLKKEAFAENFNIIGQKLKRRWQMCFRACLLVSPFKTNKCKSRWFKLKPINSNIFDYFHHFRTYMYMKIWIISSVKIRFSKRSQAKIEIFTLICKYLPHFFSLNF